MDYIHEGPVQVDQVYRELSNAVGTEHQPHYQSIAELVSSMSHQNHDTSCHFPATRKPSGGSTYSDYYLKSLRESYDAHQNQTMNFSGQPVVKNTTMIRCTPVMNEANPTNDGFETNMPTKKASTTYSAETMIDHNHNDSFNLIAAANASFAATFSDEQLQHLEPAATRRSSLPVVQVQRTSAAVAPAGSQRCGKWQQRFNELVEFKKEYDHCSVPTHWPQNHALAQWVKRQRSQYKLKKCGNHSNLIDSREKALDDLAFIWDSHLVFWEERLNELRSFRDEHGHANVPTTYPKNQQLAFWAKCQRRQYKLLVQRDPQSNMTQERIAKLSSVGFIFDPRKSTQKFPIT
jgi:hypothetical protein